MFALEPAEWMYNPLGSVHGGIAATLLDSCMGCAVHTTLGAGVGYTTTDLQVRYLRGDAGRRPGACSPRAASSTPGAARRPPRAVCTSRRTAEVLFAHASTGCAILG